MGQLAHGRPDDDVESAERKDEQDGNGQCRNAEDQRTSDGPSLAIDGRSGHALSLLLRRSMPQPGELRRAPVGVDAEAGGWTLTNFSPGSGPGAVRRTTRGSRVRIRARRVMER